MKMLIGSEFLIFLLITLGVVIFVNPLILLEGVANLLKRQRRSRSAKETERKLLAYHQKALEKMEKQMQTNVQAELKAMANRHLQTLAKLDAGQELENAAKKYLADTKMALAGLVAKTEERVDDELNQELNQARAEIKAYREKRLKKIDDKIATLVEKTIYRTLGRGLSREDHLDIIYKSLAEAKEEEFFG